MIIRRRHTANYTTIGNALFEDERLAADEVGVLAFLLSRPNHWEVRRPALMRRWKVGRDSVRRILRNLIRYGWVIAYTTRLSNGTVHIIYEVRDEPGPELTADEARAALSLVSSDAGQDETAESDEGDVSSAYGSPPTGQPGAVSRLRQSHPGYKEESVNPDSESPESTKAARGFSEVREVWPIEHILSSVTCEALHAGLNDELKEGAFQGARVYLDDCRKQNRKICDLATYYRERRWERFAIKATRTGFFHLTRETAAQTGRWRAWIEHNEPHKLKFFEQSIAAGRGYTVLSEWPPGKAASPAAIDPPTPTLSDEDADALINIK